MSRFHMFDSIRSLCHYDNSRNFKYIEPTEIILNKEQIKRGEKKESFHYVNIIDSFKALIEDENVSVAINEATNQGVESWA